MANKYWKKIGFILATLLFLGRVQGQTVEYEKEVRQMFSPSAKMIWMKHLRGFVSNQEWWISIGFDGKEVKGNGRIASTYKKWALEGTLEKSHLELFEVDDNQQICGKYLLDNKLQKWNGIWQNVNQTTQLDAQFDEVKDFEHMPTDTLKMVWMRRYRGYFGTKKIECYLHKFSRYDIVGTVWKEETNKSYPVVGQINKQGEIELKSMDNGKLIFTLQSHGYNNQGKIFKYTEPSKTTHCVFKVLKEYPVEVKEFSDYNGCIYGSLPSIITTNPDFKALSDALDGWILAQSKLAENDTLINYRFRNKFQNNLVFVPSYLGEDLISGIILKKGIHQDSSDIISFTTKLDRTERINLYEIFKSSGDYHRPITDAIYEYKNAINPKVPKHREWLDAQDFSTLSLQKESLLMTSKWSPVWGYQSISIPFEKLKNYLKSNSILNKID